MTVPGPLTFPQVIVGVPLASVTVPVNVNGLDRATKLCAEILIAISFSEAVGIRLTTAVAITVEFAALVAVTMTVC